MYFRMTCRFLGCALCWLGASGLFASPAWSQWMLGIGGIFSSSPYKDYSKWTSIPIIGYNGEYVYMRGTQGGLN